MKIQGIGVGCAHAYASMSARLGIHAGVCGSGDALRSGASGKPDGGGLREGEGPGYVFRVLQEPVTLQSCMAMLTTRALSWWPAHAQTKPAALKQRRLPWRSKSARLPWIRVRLTLS